MPCSGPPGSCWTALGEPEDMASKKKGKTTDRQRERRRKNAAGPATQPRGGAPGGRVAAPDPRTLRPPVHFTADGERIDAPEQVLGLAAGNRDPAQVRAAWTKRLREHPPEQDPEGARRLREARDRLLDPKRLIERELGVLRVPDAQAWGLPTSPLAEDAGLLDAQARLLGQAALYVLVEDALMREGLHDYLEALGRDR